MSLPIHIVNEMNNGWSEHPLTSYAEDKVSRKFDYKMKSHFKARRPGCHKLLKPKGRPLKIPDEEIPIHILDKKDTILNMAPLEKTLERRKTKKMRRISKSKNHDKKYLLTQSEFSDKPFVSSAYDYWTASSKKLEDTLSVWYAKNKPYHGVVAKELRWALIDEDEAYFAHKESDEYSYFITGGYGQD
jgi:hypothetical protein